MELDDGVEVQVHQVLRRGIQYDDSSRPISLNRQTLNDALKLRDLSDGQFTDSGIYLQ